MDFASGRGAQLLRRQEALDARFQSDMEAMRARHIEDMVRLVAQQAQEWAVHTARYEMETLWIWRGHRLEARG